MDEWRAVGLIYLHGTCCVPGPMGSSLGRGCLRSCLSWPGLPAWAESSPERPLKGTGVPGDSYSRLEKPVVGLRAALATGSVWGLAGITLPVKQLRPLQGFAEHTSWVLRTYWGGVGSAWGEEAGELDSRCQARNLLSQDPAFSASFPMSRF